MAMATEKIYKCGHCGTTNDSLESLKQHMLNSHMTPQLEPVSAASDSLLPQQIVSQVVPHIVPESTSSVIAHTKLDESLHVNPLHMAPAPSQPITKPPGKFKCGHCGIIVTTMDKLKSHMLTTHVNDQTGEYAGQRQQQVASQQPSDAQAAVQAAAKAAMSSDSGMDGSLGVRGMDENEEAEDGDLGPEIQANKVELNFSVMIPDSELHVFPRHVEPALYFTCKYCDFKSKQYKSVSNHVAAVHPKKLAPAVRAQRQELQAVSAEGYPNRARTRVVKPLPYPCGFCNLSFESQVDQSVHQRCHIADSKMMRCCFCSREAPEHRPWKMLYRHIVTMHPGNVTPKHLCKYCGVACMFPHNLKIHLKTEHGVEEDPADTGDGVTCEHCQKSFKHASYLKYHLVIRHGIGTSEEKAKITAQSQRKKEQKIENKRHKPMMTCKLCSYQTNDQYRLRTHTEVVHQGVKRHKCGVCNTAFSDYSTLRRHMWRHRDSKPYSCQFCGFTCIQSTQIKSHYKNKHGMSPADAKKLIRHINGPRHSLSANETTTQAMQQPAHAQQVVITQQPAQQQHQQNQQQATVIHQQQMVQVHHQQNMQQQTHQVHQQQPQRTVDVQIQGPGQHNARTYTVFNDGHGMEYTDIQALADAAEGLLAAEQIVIATS
ncbi:zinc finger protein 823-like isoform X2 [Watersipora subatra]|uniref:zinc finger protein 823-like isoform X2 n=1 Tax=Watersipora subatra TaxID=2589382 RepID=UPI00355C8D02